MLEELKFLIESLDGLDDLALYILGGFASYKLIVYLSTTGAFVYLTKMAIEKFSDILLKPKKVDLDGLLIHESDFSTIVSELKKYRSTSYLHSSDVREVVKALEDGRKGKQKK